MIVIRQRRKHLQDPIRSEAHCILTVEAVVDSRLEISIFIKSQQKKMPSPKVVLKAFWLITVKVPNSY